MLGLDNMRKYRYVNGEWKRVILFPHVKVEVHQVSKFACMALRHDGKGFHAALYEPEVAIELALNDWLESHPEIRTK